VLDDCCAGGGVEEEGVAEIEAEGDLLLRDGRMIGGDPGNEGAGVAGEVEVAFCSHRLDEFDHGLERARRRAAGLERAAGDVFRAEAQGHRLAGIASQTWSEGGIYLERDGSWRGGRESPAPWTICRTPDPQGSARGGEHPCQTSPPGACADGLVSATGRLGSRSNARAELTMRRMWLFPCD